MINCKFDNTDPIWVSLVQQVARLEQLWGFPKGAESKRELCIALANCDSIKEAEFLIDLYVRSETTERCPSPPDIRSRIALEHGRNVPDPISTRMDEWRATFGVGTRPEREALLVEHQRILDMRRRELHLYPKLNRMEWDENYIPHGSSERGYWRKLQTPLRDRLEAMTQQLRAAW